MPRAKPAAKKRKPKRKPPAGVTTVTLSVSSVLKGAAAGRPVRWDAPRCAWVWDDGRVPIEEVGEVVLSYAERERMDQELLRWIVRHGVNARTPG